jgi:hypothetical protein
MTLSLASRMLSNNKYPVVQCGTLTWIIGNRRIERRVSDRDVSSTTGT